MAPFHNFLHIRDMNVSMSARCTMGTLYLRLRCNAMIDCSVSHKAHEAAQEGRNTSDPVPSFASAVPTRPLPTRVNACTQTKCMMLLPWKGQSRCGPAGVQDGTLTASIGRSYRSYLFRTGFLLCRYNCHGAASMRSVSCATRPSGVVRKLKPDRWSCAACLI